MLRGLVKTLRLDPKLVVLEAVRRLFGISYRYRNLKVANLSRFRLLVNATLKGFEVWGDEEPCICIQGYTLCAPDNLISVVISEFENYEKWYGYLDVENKVVLDIGSFIGGTILMFLSKGARMIYAVEPVFHGYLRRFVEMNNLGDRVVVVPYGVWSKRWRVRMAVRASGSGLHVGDTEIQLISLKELIGKAKPDVMKVDCEGCEWAFTDIACHDLDMVKEIAMEIHGSETYIVQHLQNCGFKTRKVDEVSPLVSVWHFYREER